MLAGCAGAMAAVAPQPSPHHPTPPAGPLRLPPDLSLSVFLRSFLTPLQGDKTLRELRWKLRSVPREPSSHELDFILSSVLGGLSRSDLPSEWEQYLLPIMAKEKAAGGHPQR